MAAKEYPTFVSVTNWESAAPAEEHEVFTSPASLTPGNYYVITCSWISSLGITPAVTGGCLWIQKGHSKYVGGTYNTHHAVFAIHATGSSDEWLTIDFSETITLNCAIWQFSGVERGTTAIQLSHTSGSGTNPNLPNLSPSPGSDMYVWMASVSRYTTDTAGTAPTGYSTIHTNTHGVTTLHDAYKSSTAASENPDAFTDMVSAEWCGATISIRNWGEYVGGQTITHPHPITVPTLTTSDYGVKTWASDGTLTMDTNYTQLLLVHTDTVGSAESDNIDVPAISGKSVLIWATLQDYLWATRINPHTVTRSGVNIAWAPAAALPGATSILVFIYD